jgi:putative protease
MNKTDVEIMAPAGNFECLRAAIEGGADSVYFGVGNLNMRAHSANNFKPEDLK